MHTLYIGITDPRAQLADSSAKPSFQARRCSTHTVCITLSSTNLCSSVVLPAPPACHGGHRNPVVCDYPRIAVTAAYKTTWPHLPGSDGRLPLDLSACRQGGPVVRRSLGLCVARSLDRSIRRVWKAGWPLGRSVALSVYRWVPDRCSGRSFARSFHRSVARIFVRNATRMARRLDS